MILSLAKVQDACAYVFVGERGMTFHKISEPILGGLSVYKYDVPVGSKPIPPKNSNTCWTPQEDLILKQLYKNGETLAVIALAVGRTSDSVRKRKFRLRVGNRK